MLSIFGCDNDLKICELNSSLEVSSQIMFPLSLLCHFLSFCHVSFIPALLILSLFSKIKVTEPCFAISIQFSLLCVSAWLLSQACYLTGKSNFIGKIIPLMLLDDSSYMFSLISYYFFWTLGQIFNSFFLDMVAVVIQGSLLDSLLFFYWPKVSKGPH